MNGNLISILLKTFLLTSETCHFVHSFWWFFLSGILVLECNQGFASCHKHSVFIVYSYKAIFYRLSQWYTSRVLLTWLEVVTLFFSTMEIILSSYTLVVFSALSGLSALLSLSVHLLFYCFHFFFHMFFHTNNGHWPFTCITGVPVNTH